MSARVIRQRRLFHVRHSCGHSAYWDSRASARHAARYPCIACGKGFGGVFHNPRTGRHVRTDPDERCPRRGCDPGVLVVEHDPMGRCCRAPDWHPGEPDPLDDTYRL